MEQGPLSVVNSAPVNLDNTADVFVVGDEKGMIVMDMDKNKNKKGGFSFFKAAMKMLRSKSSKKMNAKPLPPVEADAKNWQKFVGSMRPLTLQGEEEEEDEFPHHSESLNPKPPLNQNHRLRCSTTSLDSFEDAMIPPSPALSWSSSSKGTMSNYASANNLHEMDEPEDEDEDVVFDDKPADSMIDAKAEEFIAHFYAQMRSQRGNY